MLAMLAALWTRLPVTWQLALVGLAGLALATTAGGVAFCYHERAVGAWRAETRYLLARADSADQRAEAWWARYRAATDDRARLADSVASLDRIAAALAERARSGATSRAALAQALARDSTTTDSLATALRTVAVLEASLAVAETRRRTDSLRAGIFRTDRDRWRQLADSAADNLAEARVVIARLSEQVKRAPVGLGRRLGCTLGVGGGTALKAEIALVCGWHVL
jgi:hypothetical protein